MPSNTPTPPRSSRIDRDVTPELRSNRSHSHRAPTEEPDHRSESRHTSSQHHKSSSHRRSTRDYTPDEEDEEEARRRRRRRDRERAEEEALSDPEERRTRRAERKERERADEEERYGRSAGERDSKRRRDRSRDSHRSRGSGRERSSRDDRGERASREQREFERQQRDRAMQEERREREEFYARQERDRGGRDRRDDRSPPRRRRRHSPSYDSHGGRADALLEEIDSEARSVCVSQLAAKLTSRDLGMFFEDKLGEGAVRDAKVVTDRISRRSKGIGYVELDALELVDRALQLSGEIVMGLPILVELTEAERNKQSRNVMPGFGPMDGRPLPGASSLPPIPAAAAAAASTPPHGAPPAQLHRDRFAGAEIPYHRLYVGSLHFDLTADDLKQVFAPFGEIEFVDLHRDAITGKSKGYCFVQYLDVEAAKTALQTMNGFELAGRQLRVSTVNEKSGPGGGPPRPAQPFLTGGSLPSPGTFQPGTGANASGTGEGNKPESLEEHRGQRMDHAMRQSLMMKLARQDAPAPAPVPAVPSQAVPQALLSVPTQPSLYVLVNNVFDPAEETDPEWDTDLADDIKGEVEAKYGPVLKIKVEKESQGEVYIQFDTLDSAAKGVAGLNGRFFGGRSLVAQFLPEATFKAHI